MNFLSIVITLVCSFLITFLLMPSLIRYFRAKKEGQQIRKEGPKWHAKKAGTPTMGGFLFIISAVITVLLVGGFMGMLTNTMWALLFVLVVYGLIGMWDDSIKIFHHQNEGFKAWQKALCQVIAAMVFTVIYQHEGFQMGFGTSQVGWWYGLFIIFWIVGFSNAVNLTDGLDGLVSGLSIISFLAYLIIALVNINQPGYAEIALFCLAMIGTLCGFFPYNHKPAKIFMGDMGSLAIGASLAAVSLLLHHEWSLLVIGIVYVCETASVIMQVASFKLTEKRIFKMTPIHHHFELCGWSEWKIDIVFWCVGLIASIIAVASILIFNI
ncbi:phospho-N-acetylmuramoyl-pentapeptide-transferase [Limosilactobacillus fastidiosus]|uniref:Phospho-N-acetylmuramoyl-pentapeptide-transferase n=1 Tax=Limosilactobacillus fastidiosus TaxID=2759855 RepID=A0A7W3TXV6_9LACO|nr:phospho-N-acetylmuramoyl-pentapeptide-transferase [Limosilactobacillus fastidiosus]MBB1085273.1 phospho-N-acetylmuramoyl-pentapeptide-transferase [Limosilactobacillus fastidiosus]MCD7085257.1 phospho-N-acetylmuramoyl-pentapeptide-transferase [Limosilactobacillus fastidiosus]MCD7115200.1 phospho-N-acetylmuramoyl-pentapeptide-transferase [Limosilactobacillus fastidiosus]MCD7115506.1 phospho-N-acetylmuramoyl-pentapeptide-transferase [Limosilactobacillus fastidiosus]